MANHLVVVVHGIGEQRPGETVDQIVAAAATDFTTHTREPLEVERDMVELLEAGFDENDRDAKLFPCCIRRVRRAGSSNPDDEAVLAEVYWADKSPAPKGPFRTVFDLMRVVLGLGYLAMENAENNRGVWTVGLIHAFTWLFYGIVAPLNAALLIGAGVLVVDLDSYPIGEAIPIPVVLGFVALFTGLAGYWCRDQARTYLVRIFARGLMGLAAAAAGIAALNAMGVGAPRWVCGALPDPLPYARYYPDLECFVRASIGLLGMAWIAVIVLALLSFPTAWIGRERRAPRDDVEGQRVIYPSICAAMIIFWLVISAALWLLLLNLTSRLSQEQMDPHLPNSLVYTVMDGNLNRALETLNVTAVCLIALVLSAIGILGARRVLREDLAEKRDLVGRMILNPALQAVLGVSLLIIAVVTFDLVMARLFGAAPGEIGWTGLLERAYEFLGNIESFIGFLMLLLGLGIYQFSDFVAGGLGVVRDIVTYAVQKECRWRADTETRADNFPVRNEINARFAIALGHLLATYKPNRLTILSHSQGTVIATQMLQNNLVVEAIEAAGAPKLTLVTMGSPVTHIYRRYFKQFFQVSIDRMPAGTRWFNIYRNDDFVGTKIEIEDTRLRNLPVDAAGHTGYFTDFKVWRQLRDVVQFDLIPAVPREMSPAEDLISKAHAKTLPRGNVAS